MLQRAIQVLELQARSGAQPRCRVSRCPLPLTKRATGQQLLHARPLSAPRTAAAPGEATDRQGRAPEARRCAPLAGAVPAGLAADPSAGAAGVSGACLAQARRIRRGPRGVACGNDVRTVAHRTQLGPTADGPAGDRSAADSTAARRLAAANPGPAQRARTASAPPGRSGSGSACSITATATTAPCGAGCNRRAGAATSASASASAASAASAATTAPVTAASTSGAADAGPEIRRLFLAEYLAPHQPTGPGQRERSDRYVDRAGRALRSGPAPAQ